MFSFTWALVCFFWGYEFGTKLGNAEHLSWWQKALVLVGFATCVQIIGDFLEAFIALFA